MGGNIVYTISLLNSIGFSPLFSVSFRLIFRETKKAHNESQVVFSIKLNFFFEKHLHQRNQSKTLCIFKIFFFISYLTLHSILFVLVFYFIRLCISLTIEMISFE